MMDDTPATWRADAQRRATARALMNYEVEQGNEPDAGLAALANVTEVPHG